LPRPSTLKVVLALLGATQLGELAACVIAQAQQARQRIGDLAGAVAAATKPGHAHARPVRISWVRLLKRVFQIDIEHCTNCGGQLRIIAAILESAVIERILTHLGLQARAPPRVPARADFQQAA